MIRIATIEDINNIYDLNTELFIVLNGLRADIFNPIGFPKDYISVMIKSSDSDYILIEEDERVVGYLLIEKRSAPFKTYSSFREDNFGYIHEIIILPEYRLKGYGKKLIDSAIEWSKEKNLTSIELNVLANNYNARAFYENVGFEEYQVKLRKKI